MVAVIGVNLVELSDTGVKQCGQSVLPTLIDCIETTAYHCILLPFMLMAVLEASPCITWWGKTNILV